MSDKQISLYPVGNGFSSLLQLDEETNILFDINQYSEEEREENKYWDIHDSLMDILPTRENRRHLSVLSISHAHNDHCRGIDDVFYLPDQNEDDEDLIHIDELWVPADIFTDDVDNDAEKIRKEAQRRLALAGSDDSHSNGNRLVVFGRKTDYPDLDNLPEEQRPFAGETHNTICGDSRDDFEVFVHCPFSEEDEDKNNESIILQVCVKSPSGIWNHLLIGGDARCSIWGKVYEETENHDRLERLDWDIFAVPHHGSYTFFSEKSREDARDNPDERSMNILNRGKEGCQLVCSSRSVKEGNYRDSDPPHIQAVNHYRNTAEDKNGEFTCLMEYPDEDDPKPLIFRFTDGGPQRRSIAPVAAVAIAREAAGATPGYGRRD